MSPSSPKGAQGPRAVPHGWIPDGQLWSALTTGGLDEKLSAWLALQCSRMPGADAGLVFIAGDPALTAVAEHGAAGRVHAEMLPLAERAAETGQNVVVWRSLDDPAAGATLLRFLVAHPVLADGKVAAVIAIQMVAHPDFDLTPSLLDLAWSASSVEASVWRTHAAGEEAFARHARHALAVLGAGAGLASVSALAFAYAAELKTALGASRVSVAKATPRKGAKLLATSASAVLNRHAPSTELIAALADEAIDQGAAVAYPALPRTRRAVALFHARAASDLRLAGALTLPLLLPDGECFGAIVCERAGGAPFSEDDAAFCEMVTSLLAPYLHARLATDGPLQRWLEWLARPAPSRRAGLGQVVAAGAGLATLAALALVPIDHRVSARAVLKPELQHAAVAPFDGFIKRAPVRPGDRVSAGQVLATLDDRDAALDRAKWSAQLSRVEQQLREALAKHDRGAMAVLQAQLKGAASELAISESKLAQLNVVAPFDGLIVSGDQTERLGAPVERGKVLYEVAPDAGLKALLAVDERDLRHVKLAQTGELLLSGAPGSPIPLAVDKITPVAVQEDGRNLFRVEGRLGSTDVRLKPGMEGNGKLVVGRKPVLWVWLDPILDAAHMLVWRLLP